LVEAGRTPREQALEWWKRQVDANRYVVRRESMPESRLARVLLEGSYAVELARGRFWILKAPDGQDVREVFLLNYWPVVNALLQEYAPAVLEGISAVRLHVEDFSPPSLVYVRHASSRSRYRFELYPGFEVRVAAGSVDPDWVTRQSVSGTEILVESQEMMLLNLPLRALRDEIDLVSAWLKNLIVSRPALEAAYRTNPRPVVLKRMSQIAAEVTNKRLSEQMEGLLAAEYPHRISRERTRVGRQISIPDYATMTTATQQPWLDRQLLRFRRSGVSIQKQIDERPARFDRFPRDRVIEQAREAKSHDAYHSTTIEGYQISPHEVSAIVRNEAVAGAEPEKVRARMAVVGYSDAFERVIGLMESGGSPIEISESLIFDLHVALFRPSVEAGIVSSEDLRGWRDVPTYIRGSRHVPPGPQKVPALMSQLLRLLNDMDLDPVTRAILAHLEFVTIHPFADGNGRIARFLMNIALCGAGLAWVTIRAEDRRRYFSTLETAQIDGDPTPFAAFLLDYIESAASQLATGRD
jgi:Fic family protein